MADDKKPVVLCVDDDDATLKLLEFLLGAQRYELRTAGDGEEALRQIAEKLPDLILLDILMPGLSGIDVLKKLRAEDATRLIPVLLLTGLSEERDKLEGIEAGCDDFISKPFSKAELTARVKALLKLSFYRRSLDDREKFEAVIHGMSDGVIVCRPDFQIIDVNASAKKFLGLGDAAKPNLLDAVFQGYSPSVTREALADLSVQRRKTFDIKREETKQFKALFLEATLDAVTNPSREIVSIVLILRDVTAQRKEQFLKQSFLGLISHKLNTPVGIIRENLGLIKAAPHDEKIDRLIAPVEKQVARMVGLLSRLFYFLDTQGRSLDEVVSLEDFKARLGAATEKLEAKYAKSCTIAAKVSRPQLGAWEMVVIEELLDNAFKFHPGKELRLRLDLRKDGLLFSDDGPGIPPEEHEKVFEPFYQVEKFFTGNVPGAGLGLTLVKRLVELNKGRLELDSAIGKGTTVAVFF